MRYLLISFCVLVLTSCSLKTTQGLRQEATPKSQITNPYFSSIDVDYVYKAKLDIYGNYFGGILIIKKIARNNHRVVFTTEFGSKVFDFSYEGDTFTKNFAVEDLDKKIIINILERDFRILIKESIIVGDYFTTDDKDVFKTKLNGRSNYYMFSKNNELKEIVNTTRTKEKIRFTFTGDRDIASHIDIKHQTIKLTMALDKFDTN